MSTSIQMLQTVCSNITTSRTYLSFQQENDQLKTATCVHPPHIKMVLLNRKSIAVVYRDIHRWFQGEKQMTFFISSDT